MIWKTTRFAIDLTRPRIMGIVNVTPDSFSDGGAFLNAKAAIHHCEELLKDGADILDIGGESTRPGSPPVPLAEELARVLPVLRAAVTLGVPVSIDTNKPQVMQAALDAGADIINDVWALRRESAAETVARHGRCGVCLMHMHGEPKTMQVAPMQGDAVPQVRRFLSAAAERLLPLGVQKDRIVLDPGIGFGKTVEQNFALLARQRELLTLDYPLLVGWSRKSSIGAALQKDRAQPPAPAERVAGSVAAALMAVERGARIVRAHDVRPTAQALAVWSRVAQAERPVAG